MYFCGVPYYKSLIGADKNVKDPNRGFTRRSRKSHRTVRKDEKYEFLQKSENYRSRSSVYVRKYVEIRLKEQEWENAKRNWNN